MAFKFEERPYSGRTFRPRPEIHLDPIANLLIVATPWGSRAAARKVIERMVEYMTLALDDSEATSPFQRLSCLSHQANNLRIATLLANESLFREENKTEYKAGVELFACLLEDDEFAFLQAGNPQVLLARNGRAFLPLGSQIDLAFDLSEGETILPALPSQLLGLDSSFNFVVNSFRARASDRVVLLSHSHLPPLLFAPGSENDNLEQLTLKLASEHPDLAFWLGLLTIETTQLKRHRGDLRLNNTLTHSDKDNEAGHGSTTGPDENPPFGTDHGTVTGILENR
jgi:hypothetical protein